MKIRSTLAALAFGLVSAAAFAATPTTTPATPANAPAKHAQTRAHHCAKGEVVKNGKCVAKN